jgi:cytochrome b involved in lipid metabolism
MIPLNLDTYYSREDVSKHSGPDSLWVIIDNMVYDLTSYQVEHPGGKEGMFHVMPRLQCPITKLTGII